MKTGHGLRRYFYEYVAYEAIRLARERTGRIIPISQAKAVRRRTDDRLAEQGRSVADPNLGVQDLLTALEASIREAVPGCEAIFADHSVTDPLVQRLQAQFMRQVGLGDSAKAVPALPISPYDPQWSQRATV